MEKRKYFKHRINELEEVYKGSSSDVAVLEELEEELHHRSTQRARKLLSAVQKSMGGNSTPEVSPSPQPKTNPPSKPSSSRANDSVPPVETIESISAKPSIVEPGQSDEEIIDWNTVLSDSDYVDSSKKEGNDQKPLLNKSTDILDTWTVLEALSPQSYKKPNDLVIGQGSVAYLKDGQEPWVRGEKSRPKANLYYMVYLGAVDLEKAMQKLLALYQDKRVERPSVRGLAALGVVLLDKRGIPVRDTGLALSSFGWSYARALQGKLHELKSWEQAEKTLVEGLEKYIYREDGDGQLLPFSHSQARVAYQWILRNCEIPAEDAIEPSFAIRLYQPFSRGEPEPPLLNSFYLDDLQKAKQAVQTQTTGEALSLYLGINQPKQRFDILKDKKYIEVALQPKYSPAARWPSNGRHSLVLLQQTAVNLAKLQLDSGGLFSVNGPPGTGKTTLLRDVVASVLVDRATALCEFSDTDDAFEHAGQMKLGNSFVHLYKLHESLRGHEILVASTNNKAVENVSKELPLKAQIAQDIEGFQYFKTVSDALANGDDETWGLSAAVLGNSKNRSEFINRAWWDDDSGLRKYFLSITGQFNPELDEDGEEIIPKVIEECDPPRSLEEAKQRWSSARKLFKEALKKSKDALDQAQYVYEVSVEARNLKVEIENILNEQGLLKAEIKDAEDRIAALQNDLKKIQSRTENLKAQERELKSVKPSFLKRLFARAEWKQWKKEHVNLRSKISASLNEHKACKNQDDECKSSLSELNHTLANLQEKSKSLHEKRKLLLSEIEKRSSICGGKIVTQDLWDLDHSEQQVFTPNFTDDAQRLRDDVFVAAIKLHKAFIDASTKQMRQNLGAFFACLGGKALPEEKQALLPHL